MFYQLPVENHPNVKYVGKHLQKDSCDMKRRKEGVELVAPEQVFIWVQKL